MHWPCLTRTCLLFLQNQHVMRLLHGGKSHIASCSYFPAILWHNLSVWFLMGSHWLIYKLIFKNLSSHCWQEWIEFFYATLTVEHTWKRKWTCRTYIAAVPNQTFTSVFIHSNRGQDHIMHIFMCLIPTTVGVGVSEIKLLKYGMTSVLDTVLISNTTICNVCQDWPVSTAYFILELGTRMGTWVVKFSSRHMKKEALHSLRVARSNRKKKTVYWYTYGCNGLWSSCWPSCLHFPHIHCDSYSLPTLVFS